MSHLIKFDFNSYFLESYAYLEIMVCPNIK